jgi:hypothetical protein
MSEELIFIHFHLGEKELVTKTYPNFSSFEGLKEDFIKELKKIPSIKNHFYGVIGFETVPYNNGVTKIINNREKTFKFLLELNIR